MGGHTGRMVDGWCAFNILEDKPAGQRLLKKFNRKWKVNIRMYLKRICKHMKNELDSIEARAYWRTVL